MVGEQVAQLTGRSTSRQVNPTSFSGAGAHFPQKTKAPKSKFYHLSLSDSHHCVLSSSAATESHLTPF